MTATTASPLVVAIDGPSGSGKSSVSKKIAERLGLRYLDTGAMYRSLAWYCIEHDIDISDVDAVGETAHGLDLELSTDPCHESVAVGGRDITADIRNPFISAVVSEVARIGGVRKELIGRQRRIIAEAAPAGGIVVEGRDITTVVAPDATARILLTASDEVRLARRGDQLKRSGYALTSSAADSEPETPSVAAQVLDRDRKDSAVNDFMTAAAGVALVDSTELDFDQTVHAVLDIVKRARHETAV